MRQEEYVRRVTGFQVPKDAMSNGFNVRRVTGCQPRKSQLRTRNAELGTQNSKLRTGPKGLPSLAPLGLLPAGVQLGEGEAMERALFLH